MICLWKSNVIIGLNILHKCFKKIRVVNNTKKAKFDDSENLIKERINLKNEVKADQMDDDLKVRIENRIEQIENEIGDTIAKEFLQEIAKTIDELGGEGEALNGSGRKKLWKILKKNQPKMKPAIPVGKRDRKGNMISNHMGLKHLYLETYMHRLRNRPINEDLQGLKDIKMKLFDLRLEFSKSCHSKPWDMIQLEKTLKASK